MKRRTVMSRIPPPAGFEPGSAYRSATRTLLEAAQRGDSNEYTQYMFYGEKKKMSHNYHNTLPYQVIPG